MKKSEKYVLIKAENIEKVEKIIEHAYRQYKAWEKENFEPVPEMNYETMEYEFSKYDSDDGYQPKFNWCFVDNSNDRLYELGESGHDCSDYLLHETGLLSELLKENSIPFELVNGIDKENVETHPFVLGGGSFYIIDGSFAKLHAVGDLI